MGLPCLELAVLLVLKHRIDRFLDDVADVISDKGGLVGTGEGEVRRCGCSAAVQVHVARGAGSDRVRLELSHLLSRCGIIHFTSTGGRRVTLALRVWMEVPAMKVFRANCGMLEPDIR